jgi:hypothetical protein
MTHIEAASPTRVRLYSHVTKTRFLHIEDSLSIGKVRLFAGAYVRSRGMTSHTNHYLDLADARVIFQALMNGEQEFNYKEYNGTPNQGRNGAVSRVLSVVVKGENAYIELKSGPGKLTSTGAITPAGKSEVAVNIGFKLYEARRLGATVLAYIRAWDVMRMLANKHAVSPPVTYLLVPTAVESNGRSEINVSPTPAEGTMSASRAATPATGNGRPVTRYGPVVPPLTLPAGNGAARQVATAGSANSRPDKVVATLPVTPGRPATRPTGDDSAQTPPAALKPPVTSNRHNGQEKTAVVPTPPDAARIAQAIYGPEEAPLAATAENLRYQDGTAVDRDNEKEVQTFRRYLAEKRDTPESKSALQAYFRQQKMA